MSGEIVTNRNTQVVEQPQATTLLAAISRAAADPSMDIEKMERLFAMHERMVKTQAEVAFNTDMALAQSEITTVVKNKRNDYTGSTYADLTAIIESISPVVTGYGFSTSFNATPSQDQGKLAVTATLSHRGGHSRQYELSVPLDAAGSGGKVNKTPVQAVGSTNSYARRYLICMIWNITTSDDADGNARRREFGKDISPERRREIQQNIITETKRHIASDAIDDAVLTMENGGLDGPEEWGFAWSFFDSKERAAMKKANERMRKDNSAKPITEAQRKRLEARIGELGLDRDQVKAHCKDKFGKEHFSDLSKEEYSELDAELEGIAKVWSTKAAAPQDSTDGLADAPSQKGVGQGVNADAAAPSMAAAQETGLDSPPTQGQQPPAQSATPTDASVVSDIEKSVKSKKFDMAYDLCRGIVDEALRDSTRARIDKAKAYVDENPWSRAKHLTTKEEEK